MTTDDVNPGGHVGVQPLPVIDVAAVPRGHNHDDEHVIGEDKSVGLIEDLRRAAESVMTDSGADRDFLSELGVSAQGSSWAIGVNLLGPARRRP
jgi:hypothetical protein